jgi:hypothetical protein
MLVQTPTLWTYPAYPANPADYTKSTNSTAFIISAKRGSLVAPLCHRYTINKRATTV